LLGLSYADHGEGREGSDDRDADENFDQGKAWFGFAGEIQFHHCEEFGRAGNNLGA
jgi:hypothetical protein